MGSLVQGLYFEIIGTNGDYTWYAIRLADRDSGWVATNVTQLAGTCDNLPMINANIDFTAAPAATAEITDTHNTTEPVVIQEPDEVGNGDEEDNSGPSDNSGPGSSDEDDHEIDDGNSESGSSNSGTGSDDDD